jgi:hypothetical protein
LVASVRELHPLDQMINPRKVPTGGGLGGGERAPPHPFLQTMVSLTVFTDHEFKPETTIASGRGVGGSVA